MKSIKDSIYKDDAMENQSALNKNPTMQYNNNISSRPSKGVYATPGKEVIGKEKYCISFFNNCTDVIAKQEELSFEEILSYFKKVAIKPFTSKQNLGAMVCGSFKDNRRAGENLISRSILTFDLDGYEEDFNSLKNEIEKSLGNYTYIYYTTSSSTLTKPRARILLFIDKDVDRASYGNLGRNIAVKLFSPILVRAISDESSFTPSQLMYLPCKVNNEFKIGKNVKELIKVDDYIAVIEELKKEDDELKTFIAISNNTPLPNLTKEKVIETLGKYDCSETNYHEWFKVCQSLHHQFKGAEEGLEIFINWSLTDSRYSEERIKRECRSKYYSVKGNVANPITFGSIIKVVKEKEKEALKEDLDKKIEKLSQYPEEKEIRSIINSLALYFSEYEADNYLQSIRDKTKWTLPNLRKILKDEQNKIEHEKSKASTDAYPLCKKLPRGVFIDFHDNRIPKGTYENFSILLEKYGIDIRYNLISKDMDYFIPGISHTKDNAGEAYYADIISICERNNIKKSYIDSYIIKLGDTKKYNPVLEFIESKPWDDKSRLNELYDTIKTQSFFPLELKELLFRKWLISAVAAAQYEKFHSKGVLVFQGQQSLGKTPWFKKLLPPEIEPYFLESGTLNVDEKDSMITAVSKWIVELGEIDTTFKKDIAKLKGFLSKGEDIIRRPYQRKNSNYPRRTIFCGTVNDEEFLKDASGNVRFWVIPVVEINYEHNIDMQQVWAEANHLYKTGERWWLDREEEQKLEFQNRRHFKTLGYEDVIVERYKFTEEINKLYEEAHLIDSLKLSEEKKIKNKKNTINLKDLGCEEKTIQEILDVLVPSESKRGGIKEEFRKSLLKLGVKRLSDNKKYLMPPKNS